jgi:parallel beta-helix repeat protein
MRKRDIWKILAVLIVLVMVGSCAAMLPPGDVSESNGKSLSATIYALKDAGINPMIRAVVDNVSDGGLIVVYNETHKENAAVNESTKGQVPPVSALYVSIWDHTMCKGVDKNGNPIHRTSSFYTTDKYMVCWFEAHGFMSEGDTFTFKWYDPYGRLYKRHTFELAVAPTELILFVELGLAGLPPATMPGNWRVELYYKETYFPLEERKFTEYFTISRPRPDLKITDIWWSGSTIYYKIKNQGPTNAGASYTSLSVDGVFKASDYVAPLSRGAVRTENFTYNWTFTPPEDIVRVCADHQNDVTEINEANNCESKYYTDIQFKIDAANSGDTIIISDGIYKGNIKVDKRLTIQSENGSANCIVQAAKPSDYVFSVTADYVNLSGFTIKGATGWGKAGICLYTGVDHCNVSGNTVLNNNRGILLFRSNKNNITMNNATNNDVNGIRLYYSNNNTITRNNASNNDDNGIYLRYSNNNTITRNNASNNDDNGIHLYYSNNNTITRNNASNNDDDGIGLYYVSNNKIYLNNFINNAKNVNSYKSTNTWNSTEEITYTYNETNYEKYLGNYWGDYNGTDTDNDGIGMPLTA